jgi:hypothetical protein
MNACYLMGLMPETGKCPKNQIKITAQEKGFDSRVKTNRLTLNHTQNFLRSSIFPQFPLNFQDKRKSFYVFLAFTA